MRTVSITVAYDDRHRVTSPLVIPADGASPFTPIVLARLLTHSYRDQCARWAADHEPDYQGNLEDLVYETSILDDMTPLAQASAAGDMSLLKRLTAGFPHVRTVRIQQKNSR